MLSHRHVVASLMLGLIIVAAGAPATRADDKPSFEQFSRQFRAAYNGGDYKKALEISEKQHELRSSATDPIYNIACMQCLLGERAKALEWLEKAIDAGYSNADHMANDYDLRSIWGEGRFRAMVQKVRERNAKSSSSPKKESDSDKPVKTASADDKPAKSNDKPARPAMTPRQRQERVQELTRQVIAASEKKEHDKALKLALEAHGVADIGLTNYNVACMYSLLGKTDEAFEYLDRCVVLGGMGGDLVEQIEGDGDLDSLRKDKRYEPLLKRAKTAGRTERVDFKWRIVTPKNFDKDKKSPLLVALHHMGGSMDAAVDRWKDAADEVGAILLCPQGTLKMSDGVYQWGFNTDEIEKNVMKAMDAAMDDYNIDQDKIVLAGFSQGGWITWHLGLTHPDTFRGLIPVCGMHREVTGSPATKADLKKLRVFVMIGADEQEDVLKSNREAAGNLEKVGAKVTTKVYNGIGHDFPSNSTEEQVAALKFVLE